jgi:hypothetical protein
VRCATLQFLPDALDLTVLEFPFVVRLEKNGMTGGVSGKRLQIASVSNQTVEMCPGKRAKYINRRWRSATENPAGNPGRQHVKHSP